MKIFSRVTFSFLLMSLFAGTSFGYQVLINVEKSGRGETSEVTYRSIADRTGFDLDWYGLYEATVGPRIAGATVQVVEGGSSAGRTFTTDSRGRVVFDAERGDLVEIWKAGYRGLSFVIPADVPSLDRRVIANAHLQNFDISARIRALILRVPVKMPVR